MAANGGSVNIMEDFSQDISMGDACYREDSEVVVKKVNYKYKQKNSIKGNLSSFAIFNDIYVYCLIKIHHKKLPKYRLDLTFFDPQPVKSLFVPWKLIASGLLMLVLALLMPTEISIPFITPVDINILYVPALFSVVGIGLLSLAYMKSYNQLIFKSFASGVPLLTLSHKYNQKKYKQFILVLQQKIKLAHKQNGITVHDRLVGEMKDLRRLKNAGIIEEELYNEAQTKILTHKLYKT